MQWSPANWPHCSWTVRQRCVAVECTECVGRRGTGVCSSQPNWTPTQSLCSICRRANVRRPYKRPPSCRRSVRQRLVGCRRHWPVNVLTCGRVVRDDVTVPVFPFVPRTTEARRTVALPCEAFPRRVGVVPGARRPLALPSTRPRTQPKIGRNTKRTPKRTRTNRCAVDLGGRRPIRSWPDR